MIHQSRYLPSACAPDRGGVAAVAAASPCVHNKSLAAWLALHVFVNALHINWVMTLMLSAEPWLYDAVIHECEQTYHSTGMCLGPRSTGAKAVSFLPSRPSANLICGVEQLPKLAPEVVEVARAVPLAGVDPEPLVPLRGCPWSFRAVTASKSVSKPKNLLNTAGKINCMKLTS